MKRALGIVSHAGRQVASASSIWPLKKNKHMKRAPSSLLFIILILLNIAIAAVSLTLGRYSFSGNESIAQLSTIYIDIRLPRILAAFLVGGTLSLTGAAYQGMFRNPMVSPSILGVSAGAGFGAALAILLALGSLATQSFSFIFGIIAVVAVYMISLSTGKKHDKCLTLILSGMIVATVFTALISILKYIADPYDTLPSIVYWLMGGLTDIEMGDLKYIAMISIPGLITLTLSGWKLDVLSFGDEEAKSIGVHVDRFAFW